jgi:hypothetical protein
MKSRKNTKENPNLCENHLFILKKKNRCRWGDFRPTLTQNHASMMNKEQVLREKRENSQKTRAGERIRYFY